MMSMAELESDYEIDYRTATEDDRPTGQKGKNHMPHRAGSPLGMKLDYSNGHAKEFDALHDKDWKEHHRLLSDDSGIC